MEFLQDGKGLGIKNLVDWMDLIFILLIVNKVSFIIDFLTIIYHEN